MEDIGHLKLKINLQKIEDLINKKKINPENQINIETLKKDKIIRSSFTKFKILGTGNIKTKLDVLTDFISKSAKEKIEKAGGKLALKKNKL